MLLDSLITLINLLLKGLAGVAKGLVSILPVSPFKDINNSVVAKYLGNLNWIIPISTMLTITVAWLSAIAVYYLVQIVLRWTKSIQ